MATHTNNNVVDSCSSTTNHDHAHTMINKRKRDDAFGRRRRRRIRNNNWGKRSSHSSSYLNPSHHDINDVCLCLSLSCRFCTATTTHDNEKKKTCNDDAVAVGKHNNLQLLQPIEDSTVCLHFLLESPSCSCDQIAKKQKHEDQECNAVGDQQWEIKKVLETSDIRPDFNRLMLKKDLAEKFVIPHLLGGAKAALEEDGVRVKVWDIDTNSTLSPAFRIWSFGKSHVFTKTWIEEFVRRRELKKGDQIGLRWDQLNNQFEFSVLQQQI